VLFDENVHRGNIRTSSLATWRGFTWRTFKRHPFFRLIREDREMAWYTNPARADQCQGLSD
jgi:hypothetical protein